MQSHRFLSTITFFSIRLILFIQIVKWVIAQLAATALSALLFINSWNIDTMMFDQVYFPLFFSPCCAEPLPSLSCACRFLFLLPSAKVFFFLRYRYFWSALLTERTLETKHSCERTFTREGSCLYTIAALLAACRRDPFFIRAAFSFRFKLLRHCSSLRGSLTQFYFFLYLWVRTLELFTFFFLLLLVSFSSLFIHRPSPLIFLLSCSNCDFLFLVHTRACALFFF